MDPLSISASALTVIAATISTLKGVHDTVKRYESRDKLLVRLQNGIFDLINILEKLKELVDSEATVLALLSGPVGHCAEVCHQFEDAMKKFSGKSKIGLIDWGKMEFMRGDINEFIDTLGDYKSTIAVGLGTITLVNSRVTEKVIGDYSEIIKDTVYSLEMRLQRIDEKMTNIQDGQAPDDSSIDFADEKDVTLQCLRICKSANSYISQLKDKQPALKPPVPQQNAEFMSNLFEAQVLTNKSLVENQKILRETIARLTEHMEAISFKAPGSQIERLQLQEEINYSKQCLEVCKEASNQVSTQKIHIIGEVIGEADCDQVVVTTVADLFNVGTVRGTNRSAQLVGSMEPDVLRQLSADRYGSRFGALGGGLDAAAAVQYKSITVASPAAPETQKSGKSSTKSDRVKDDERSPGLDSRYNRPSPNEVRRRTNGSEDGTKKAGYE